MIGFFKDSGDWASIEITKPRPGSLTGRASFGDWRTLLMAGAWF